MPKIANKTSTYVKSTFAEVFVRHIQVYLSVRVNDITLSKYELSEWMFFGRPKYSKNYLHKILD